LYIHEEGGGGGGGGGGADGDGMNPMFLFSLQNKEGMEWKGNQKQLDKRR